MTRCVTDGDSPEIAESRHGEEVFMNSLVIDRPTERPPTSAPARLTSRGRTLILALVAFVLMPRIAAAQGASPWENAVDVLRAAFTGPIARGLSLVAIVVGGLAFAYGEGQSKRMIAGIVFGVGMAIGAVNFMAWLFP
jgi:type IV secretory pathway VirB2 component (pilin)